MYYQNHYLTLAIPPWATEDEIVAAYRHRLKLCHPDRLPENANLATALTQRVNAAYDILNDKRKRQQYDKKWEADEFVEIIPNPKSVLPFSIRPWSLESIGDKFGNEIKEATESQWRSLYLKTRAIYLKSDLQASVEQRLQAIHDIDLVYNWESSFNFQNHTGIEMRSEYDPESDWDNFHQMTPMIRIFNKDTIAALIGSIAILGIGPSKYIWMALDKFEPGKIQIYNPYGFSIQTQEDANKYGGNIWDYAFYPINFIIGCNTSIRSNLIEQFGFNSYEGGVEREITLAQMNVAPATEFFYQVCNALGLKDGDLIYLGYE